MLKLNASLKEKSVKFSLKKNKVEFDTEQFHTEENIYYFAFYKNKVGSKLDFKKWWFI